MADGKNEVRKISFDMRKIIFCDYFFIYNANQGLDCVPEPDAGGSGLAPSDLWSASAGLHKYTLGV